MSSENRSISRYETTAVYTHPEAKVDIVLVHGLNGDPEKTWKAKNGVFWPLDLLPASLRDAHANIMVYGYNADVYSKKNDRSASDNFIHQHAQTLVTNLTLFRRDVGTFKNPIIWVCHSLGGILVKKALLYSNDLRAEDHQDYRSIYVSTYSIIFLGTPHTGSDGAKWGLVLQAMSDAVVLKRFFDSESVLLRTLKRDNETLSSINSHFLDIYQRFKIHMAHENYKTDIKGTKTIVVDAKSASPQLPDVTYYGIEATHSGMCKFDGLTAPGYRNVSTIIRKWIYEAPAVIHVRWEVEEMERRARARNEIAERLRPYMGSPSSEAQGSIDQDPLISIRDQTTTEPLLLGAPEPPSPAIDEPLFIHPERFRPNSFFKGREQDLADLHRMLLDRDRRAQGTSAVVIRSIPGGGKSHLAREYAFRSRHSYPGGVFWVRAKSQEDLEEGFLKMARNGIIRQGIHVEDEAELHDPHKAVRHVRRWLNHADNWLLILDGVLSDTPSISRFVPDSKNTSLILTSTDSSIANNRKFDDPQKLELGPLSVVEAQELLLEEMDKDRPWSDEDVSRAQELVKLMECNPLAVHAVARQLRATREPLSKYIRSYKSRPRTGGLNAYRAVREKLQERGEMESLNLIYLLSFFNEQFPVEMLALGLKALDKRTPVRTHDSLGRRSLNKTFTVLIAFALIDRDLVDDVPSISTHSSSQGSKYVQVSEPLDVLSIQSFVQNFFLETLKKEDQFNFWLERSAAVLCKSYDEANILIQRHPEVGLPNDYRRYGSQFRRVLKHIERVDRPSQELRRVQQALLARFGDIQEQVNVRSRRLGAHAASDDGEGPIVSVFERTNSWSVSSSTTTAESDDDTRPLPQRTLSHPYGNVLTLDLSPHQHHIPYPTGNTIPGPDFVSYEDDGYWIVDSPQTEDQISLEPHRTVKKMAQKRYHDRAGAWRETKERVNEPRVSISNENARVRISPVLRSSSPGGTSSRDFRGAQDHLHQISTACQRVPSSGDSPHNHKSSSAISVPEEFAHLRDAQSQRPESFSPQGTTQAPGMSRFNSQQKASQQSIPKLDENPFFEGSSRDMITRSSQLYDTPEWRPAASGGVGSMHSTGNNSDSYLELESQRWQISGLPVVTNQRSSLIPAPVPVGRSGTGHRASDSGYAGEHLSNSFPNSQTGTLQPPPWRPIASSPDGYTSQPMSRDPSASNPELAPSHYSSPVGSAATSQTLPINTRRAPSMAATEPSPRVRGLDSVPTSYQVWQQRHADPWSPVSRGSSPTSQGRRPLSRDSGVPEAADMERTGSGGIKVDGRIVQFGESPPLGGAYPQEIHEENEEVMSAGGGPVGLGIIKEDTRRSG